MELTLINHACVSVANESTTLVCDPWLTGPAFHEGWEHIVPSAWGSEELAAVDAIWVSHEHADHFSPRDLLSIPEEARSRIDFVFQPTLRRRVANFCEKKGFRVTEPAEGERHRVGPSFTIRVGKVPIFDSYALMEVDGVRILNLNDCVVRSESEVRDLAEVVGPIDVLLTQFSYAAWQGNRDQTHVRTLAAEAKREVFLNQVRYLQPRYVIPFASFVRFGHEENAHLNDAVNMPGAVPRWLEEAGLDARTEALVLKPGEPWTPGEPVDSAANATWWAARYREAMERPFRKAPEVSIEEVQEAAQAFDERLREMNSPVALRLIKAAPFLHGLGPIDIFLWDHRQTVRYSFGEGLRVVDPSGPAHLEMSTHSLKNVFGTPWGIDTLTVNGRFQVGPRGMATMAQTFGPAMLNYADVSLDLAALTDPTALRFLGSLLVRVIKRLRAAS